MTRFGALDRELAEAVLHTMILVARDGVHALDDVHRRLGRAKAADRPPSPEPPGERWQSLLGELFRTQVRYVDLPGLVAGQVDEAGDERSASVIAKLVGAAGAFLTAESLVFEERLALLPGPGVVDESEPSELQGLLERVCLVADDVLDHAAPGCWPALAERYRVPPQARPPQGDRLDLPVLVVGDRGTSGDVAVFVHRQILAVRERHRDFGLDVRFASAELLREVLDVARAQGRGEPDTRIRFDRAAAPGPIADGGRPDVPLAAQLTRLTREVRPQRPGHLVLVAGPANAVPDADLRLAILDLDAQGLLPDLRGWTVSCVDTGTGAVHEGTTGYLRELCLAGGARSFDVLRVGFRLPQPSRERLAGPPAHPASDGQRSRGKRRRRARTVAEPTAPVPPPADADVTGRVEWLRSRIQQVRSQSAQIMEGHVVGPHGQNLTVREAQARADLLDGLIEMDQVRGRLRHRRTSRLTRAVALAVVFLLDLPIVLWLSVSGFADALGTPTWLTVAAGGLLAAVTTGSGAVGLHQLGRNQRQYKNVRRQLVWTNLPAATKRVLSGVAVLASGMGTVAAARIYVDLAHTDGLVPVGWPVAGTAGTALIGSAAFLFWAAFRDGSLEQDDLRHYSECVRPFLLQKRHLDDEEYELRREYQRLTGVGDCRGDAATSLDDLRRRAGDLTDAQLMDRSLDEHGASPVLLAYAERWHRTDHGQQLLTMVRESSGPTVQNALAEHQRHRASDKDKTAPAEDGQITAGSE